LIMLRVKRKMSYNNIPYKIPPINGVTFSEMQFAQGLVFSCDNCRKLGLEFYINIDEDLLIRAGTGNSIFDMLKQHALQHNDIVKQIEAKAVTIRVSAPKFYVLDDSLEVRDFDYEFPKAEELKSRRMLRPYLIKNDKDKVKYGI